MASWPGYGLGIPVSLLFRLFKFLTRQVIGEEVGRVYIMEGDQTFDLWPMKQSFWNMANQGYFIPLWPQVCSCTSAGLESPIHLSCSQKVLREVMDPDHSLLFLGN